MLERKLEMPRWHAGPQSIAPTVSSCSRKGTLQNTRTRGFASTIISSQTRLQQETTSHVSARFRSSNVFISRFDSTRNDRHGEVYPGRQQVKMIHGNDSSRDSLRNGHATMYPCVGCRQCLVANNGTKLLYCHRCGMLTPTDISGEVEGV